MKHWGAALIAIGVSVGSSKVVADEYLKASEAARHLAHFDFLMIDCGIKFSVSDETLLRGLVIKHGLSWTQRQNLKDVRDMAKKQSKAKICDQLGAAYGVSKK